MMKKKIIKQVEEEIMHSNKAVRYGLFTPYELEGAIQCFDTDFGELFWALENLNGLELESNLLNAKYEYQLRLMENENYNDFGHHYKKLMLFIDRCIKYPKKIKFYGETAAKPKITFIQLFVDKNIGQQVLEQLEKQKYIIKVQDNYEWKDKYRGNGKKVAALVRYLWEKNVFISKYSNNKYLFSDVFKNEFNFDLDYRTFHRMHELTEAEVKKFNFLNL